MTPEETICAAREIRDALPDGDREASRCYDIIAEYYLHKTLGMNVATERDLEYIRSWIIRNRHRATEQIMDL